MKRSLKAGLCVPVLLLFFISLHAQEVVQYLPQLADGGGWMTTFTAINQAASAVTVTIDLFAPNGAPLPVLGTGSGLTFALAVGGSAQVQTLGPSGATTRVGYARVRSSGVVGVAAVFQF